MKSHIKYFTICKYLKDRKFNLRKSIELENQDLTQRFEYWSNEKEETYI